MGQLDGKVAWITGAGTGIGLAGARALAAEGAHVVLSGRRREVLEAVAADLPPGGGGSTVLPLDVADAAEVARAAQAILAARGQVDILLNSAGLNNPKRSFADQTIAGWREVVGINLDGTYNTIHAVLPSMRARRDGLIINVSSWAGRFDGKMTGAAYNASKHAVVSLTATLNMEECINGIRACALCPAEVATPIMDRRPVPPSPQERARMLQPEDMGRTVAFVATMPPHVCVNEILISPTWNRIYLGTVEVPKG